MTPHPLTDPGAWMLDPTVVHANHGSFGGITRDTWEVVTAARREVLANPMRFFERDWEAAHVAAVGAVAGLVDADPGTTALVPNATFGLELALRVLPWRSGARILRTDHAYPSVVAALDDLAARSGAEIVEVALPLDAAADADVATLLAAADGVDGVVLDHASSATARWLPVERLVPALREAGVVVVVDAAHAPGHVPTSVRALAADAWVGNLHKWACAPHALAAVVLAPRHATAVGPLVHSAASSGHVFPDDSAWWGTADPGPLLVAPQVVTQATDVLARLRPRLCRLAAEGAAHVAAAVGGRVPAGGDGWMRVVELPRSAGTGAARARQVQDAVAARGVEAKVSAWHDHLLLRLSTHAYTRPDDPERVARALVEVLDVGRTGRANA